MTLLTLVRPHATVTTLPVMCLLGMMSADHTVVPPGVLHMRRLQRWFARLRMDPAHHKRRIVVIPSSLAAELNHWREPHTFSAGVLLIKASNFVPVFTNASLSGWGGRRVCPTWWGDFVRPA